jgi:DNA-binding MarR family transcriptional regulator
MAAQEPSAQTLAALLAQLGRAAYNIGSSEELTPAQWMALRYFARANRFSRTVSAFADYHGTTRGTASQTVNRLVEQHYLTRKPSARDRRSARLELTKKGRGVLRDDPLEALVRAVRIIPNRTRADMTRRLGHVFECLAQERGERLFGVCPSCRYLESEGSSVEGDHTERCRLFGEALRAEELEQICVNFEPIRRVRSGRQSSS